MTASRITEGEAQQAREQHPPPPSCCLTPRKLSLALLELLVFKHFLQLRICPPVYSSCTGSTTELPYSCAAQVPQSVSIGNSSCYWLSQCFRSANYLFLVMTNKSKRRTVLEGVCFKIHWLGTKVGTALTAAVWITVILSKKCSVFGDSWWRQSLASLYCVLMTARVGNNPF